MCVGSDSWMSLLCGMCDEYGGKKLPTRSERPRSRMHTLKQIIYTYVFLSVDLFELAKCHQEMAKKTHSTNKKIERKKDER